MGTSSHQEMNSRSQPSTTSALLVVLFEFDFTLVTSVSDRKWLTELGLRFAAYEVFNENPNLFGVGLV